MVLILKRQTATHRVYIHDLRTKKARSITLVEEDLDLDQLKEKVIKCLEQKV